MQRVEAVARAAYESTTAASRFREDRGWGDGVTVAGAVPGSPGALLSFLPAPECSSWSSHLGPVCWNKNRKSVWEAA